MLLSRHSPYSYLEVVQRGEELLLKPQANYVHSVYHPDRLMTGSEWDYYCLGPLLRPDMRKVLVLGMGGGTSVRQFLHLFPRLSIDALDLDPVVVEVAVEHFGIPAHSPRLELIVDDARAYLQGSAERYDLISVDLFRGGLFIPFFLSTQEFFALCRDHLAPGGLVIMNVNVAPGQPPRAGPTLAGCVGRTLESVFPAVYRIDLEAPSVMFLAFRDPTGPEDVRAALAAGELPSELRELARYSAEHVRELPEEPESFVLTDDRAPIEELTYPIAASYYQR